MSSFNINDYIQPLKRWWWLVAVATLIAMISSYIYSSVQPAIYKSQATIMIGSNIQDPNPTGNEFYLAQQLAETYADIAMRAPIRSKVMDRLGVDWLPYYSVSPIPNTQMLEVQVFDQDADRAYQVASELVNQLILQGPTQKEQEKRRAFIDEQLEKLQTSIQQTEEEITKQEDEQLKITSARELANKQTEITALQTKLTTLRTNFADLLATTRGAVNALQVLEPASLPTEPQPSNLLVNIFVASVLGIVLAAGGAYLLEYLDDSIKGSEEIKNSLNLTLLGTVPDIPEAATGSSRRLVALNDTPSPALESYRILRTNLQFASIDRPLRQILLTSAQPEEGKSLTSANLSAALARAGKKVILVDADLHRPTQHRLFKLFNNIGVTTALLNEDVDYEMLLQPTSLPGLSVLTSGPLPPNPAEMLGSRRMHDVLKALQELADIVVIDSPPVTAVVDAVILATQTDGVLMVMRCEKSSREAIKRSLSALNQVKAPILGAVLNGVSEHKKEYYMHSYGYYSSVYGRALTTTAPTNPTSEGTDAVIPVPTMSQGNSQVMNGGEASAALSVPMQELPPSMPAYFAPQAVADAGQEHPNGEAAPYHFPVVSEPAATEPEYAGAPQPTGSRPPGHRRSGNILRRRSPLPWR